MAAFLMQLFLFSLLHLLICSSASNHDPKAYVVYMGSGSPNGGGAELAEAESAHLQLLSSIIPSEERERIALIHHYNHAFKGFSAMLTDDEASALSGHEEIVSIFPDPVLELHTTRSWDFLESESAINININGKAKAKASSSTQQNVSTDVIIGVIDTGIWPESHSFSDKGIGEIPSRWKGICMEGPGFNKSNCNRKLIGARYYKIQSEGSTSSSSSSTSGSPRDSVGHGTHTSSIAGGSPVSNASYYGLGLGTARGGSPSARIAAYKACSEEGCSGSTILKAIDDALLDGVDIISVSIGMTSLLQSDFLADPIAIGAFHADQKGVLVVCSGGNDGPDPYTVVNSAPWIFTVAASNIDRDFQSTILLGNGKSFQGSAISFGNLKRSKPYPLAFGKSVASPYTPASEARNCYPGSLDRKKAGGKIVVCEYNEATVSRHVKKLVAEDAKAKGVILIQGEQLGVPYDSGAFPFAQVGVAVGLQILNYINSTKKPTATILASAEIKRYKPAPTVADFSSRGPGGQTENILKPDITAPGVAILAAVSPKADETNIPPIGKKLSLFSLKSGTSMACPHVTGAAAYIKSVHRKWTSSMIKSALMTTATTSNNLKRHLTNSSNHTANPHDVGVGEINPSGALNPGLVFETTTKDYMLFLCYLGYPEKKITSLSSTKFVCPKKSSQELISNINYPSISISKLDRHISTPQTVQRTVTNVGSPNATYVAFVDSPTGLVVRVSPRKLVFVEGVPKRAFKVSFSGKEAQSGYNFGSITWVNGRNHVRTQFAVNAS